MRVDRDGLILFLTLIPAGFGLYCFFVWQTTGGLPFSLPSLDFIPSTGVPAFLRQYDSLPTPVLDLEALLRRHWRLVAPGLAIGLVAGFFAVGALVDLIRVTFRRARDWRRSRRSRTHEQLAREITKY